MRSIILAVVALLAAPAAAGAATVTADGTTLTYQSRTAAAVRVYEGASPGQIVLRSSELIRLTQPAADCALQTPRRVVCAGTETRLSVDLSPFTDQLWVTGLPNLDTTAYGHGGDDSLITGAGDDVLYGGLGTDYLNGRGGTNILHQG